MQVILIDHPYKYGYCNYEYVIDKLPKSGNNLFIVGCRPSLLSLSPADIKKGRYKFICK